MRSRWWALLMLIPSLAFAADTRPAPGARWWGLIVGVGHYENLQGFDLEGPPQDVPLVLNWLRRQRVPRRQLTVLADQVVDADGLPKRAAILEALNRLPARMQRGDVAFIYLAGHGAQQPQGGADWSKADGMDEIFLPRDVGLWDGSRGQVEGSLNGAELGSAMDALRARGIFVWLVVDSCHSATLARTTRIPHLRLRAVPPEALHEPPATAQAPLGDVHLVHVAAKELPGRYVAFYAAQTTETAPEMPLPAGELNNSVHGLFSFALLKSLSATANGSYRELAHRILAFYAATYPATTPEFEGALDGPLGSPDAPLITPDAWPASRDGERFRIEAGRLSGVTPGSLLALHAALGRGPPLGLLEVERASLTEAWAHPVRSPAALHAWKIPVERSDELAAGTVQMLKSSVDLTVRIARPVTCLDSSAAPGACRDDAAVGSALAKARALMAPHDLLPPGATLTDTPDSADIFLLVHDQRLYVLKASDTPLTQAAFVELNDADASSVLSDIMRRAVRAAALLRLATDFPEEQPQLQATLRARGADGRWRSDHLEAVSFGSELSLQLQTVAATDIDVTVLSVTDNWAIVPVYPVDQESNLLRRGAAALSVSGWARSHGDIALVFIVEESHGGHPHDLGYLAQPGITRAAAGEGLTALLERAGFSAGGERGSLTVEQRHTASLRVLHYFVGEAR